MTPELIPEALPWAALAAIALTAAAAASVLMARSLFSACVGLAAVCASGAGALLALGYGDGALTLALVGAGVAPVLLLAGVLLTARAARPRRGRFPWLSMTGALGAAAALMWVAPTLAPSEAIASPRGVSIAFAALIFVAVAACVALLGYGERGILHSADRGRDA